MDCWWPGSPHPHSLINYIHRFISSGLLVAGLVASSDEESPAKRVRD
jgi:hypothetical protein